jgi:hypothetical protein
MEGCPVPIVVDALDNRAIRSVAFAINGIEQRAVKAFSYSMLFTTLEVTETTLSVTATDNFGRSATDTRLLAVIP